MLLYRKVTKDLNNNMENVMIILYEKILTALNTLESDDFYSTTSIDGGHIACMVSSVCKKLVSPNIGQLERCLFTKYK